MISAVKRCKLSHTIVWFDHTFFVPFVRTGMCIHSITTFFNFREVSIELSCSLFSNVLSLSEDCMTSEDLRALAMMSCHMF